jgi:hypothetical protein
MMAKGIMDADRKVWYLGHVIGCNEDWHGKVSWAYEGLVYGSDEMLHDQRFIFSTLEEAQRDIDAHIARGEWDKNGNFLYQTTRRK